MYLYDRFAHRMTKVSISLSFLCVYLSIYQADTAPNPLAKEELNLLAKLMGSMEVQERPSGNSGFRVNLFATDQEEEEA